MQLPIKSIEIDKETKKPKIEFTDSVTPKQLSLAMEIIAFWFCSDYQHTESERAAFSDYLKANGVE